MESSETSPEIGFRHADRRERVLFKQKLASGEPAIAEHWEARSMRTATEESPQQRANIPNLGVFALLHIPYDVNPVNVITVPPSYPKGPRDASPA